MFSDPSGTGIQKNYCLVLSSEWGVDPYISFYIIPNNSPHNPVHPLATKNQTGYWHLTNSRPALKGEENSGIKPRDKAEIVKLKPNFHNQN